MFNYITFAVSTDKSGLTYFSAGVVLNKHVPPVAFTHSARSNARRNSCSFWCLVRTS